jgi:hypothetical protein
MRILDKGQDRAISKISILFTKDEAAELRDALSDLVENQGKRGFHHHVNNADYSKEIIVALYTENEYSEFDQRTQRLIQDDS